MSTRQIAWLIKEPAERITQPISRLVAYGFLQMAGRESINGRIERVYRINVKEAAYR